MKPEPVFIHSLFRSGSTYFFKKFRELENLWCFQESVHEIAFYANDSVEILAGHDDQEMQERLRHPKLDAGYFYELGELWGDWRGLVQERSIYEDYFWTSSQDAIVAYLLVLANKSKSRAVFQECRTACRIGALKKALGGHHIYLWRNPWDQWWSYKVGEYFDAVNQIIINADNVPLEVSLLKAQLKITPSKVQGVNENLEYYSARPLSASNSYLVFYMLWCLGLREGNKHADIIVNIDLLGVDSVYRKQLSEMLEGISLPSICFDDCAAPRSIYLAKDREFFAKEQALVHLILLQSGWAAAEIELVCDLSINSFSPSIEVDFEALGRVAEVTRGIAIRGEDKLQKLASMLVHKEENLIGAGEAYTHMLAQKDKELAGAAEAYAHVLAQKDKELAGAAEAYAHVLAQKDKELAGAAKAYAHALAQKDKELADAAEAYAHVLAQKDYALADAAEAYTHMLAQKDKELAGAAEAYTYLRGQFDEKLLELSILYKQ
jgi:hypothetical protein